MNDPVVYGEARVRRLRSALGAAVGLGVVTGVIALVIATQVDEDGAGTYAVVLGIVSFGSILWAVISWRLLEVPTRTAKRAVILTGALMLLFALATFQVVVGLFYIVLGLVLVFLATVSEDGA